MPYKFIIIIHCQRQFSSTIDSLSIITFKSPFLLPLNVSPKINLINMLEHEEILFRQHKIIL